MYYSLNLLKQFIAIDDTPQQIAAYLTQKSCEIEHVQARTIPADVVIGKVTAMSQHPNADKLKVCQVNCGSKGSYQICTAAENVLTDSYVPVALPGCYLPGIDLKIEARKMRGEDSNGMICSKNELGILEDTEEKRIWNLQTKTDNERQTTFDDIVDADCGTPLSEKYPRLDNAILDVDNKTLTHRPDLTGHFGLANELYAIYMHENKEKIKFQSVQDQQERFVGASSMTVLDHATKATTNLDIQTSNLRSYICLELNDIHVSSSSFFTRVQMLDLHVQPRNNWVDFSNIFMCISGQPIHFFDANKVSGNLIIRQAKHGELFTDLFDKTHILTPEDIVIADTTKILALGGIIGGKDSCITTTTKKILVEIANFDPVSVRKTANRLGLRTDAVMRNEKNINPVFSLHMAELFLDSMKQYAIDLGTFTFGGLVYRQAETTRARVMNQPTIDLNIPRMQKIICGQKMDDLPDQAREILKNIGCRVHESNTEHRTVSIPHRRGPKDLTIPEDLVEEIARIYGYDAINPIIATTPLIFQPFIPRVQTIRTVEETLVRDHNAHQVETYPRTHEKLLDIFGTNKEKLLSLQNAVAPEMSYLRDSMVYNLFDYVRKNHKFFDTFTMFDIGKVRTKNDSRDAIHRVGLESTKPPVAPITERTHLGGIIYQKTYDGRKQDGLLIAKRILTSLQRNIGLPHFTYKPSKDEHYHPMKQGNISIEGIGTMDEEKKHIGFLGQIHPSLLMQRKIDENAQVIFFSLDVDTIISFLDQQETTRKPSSYETLQDQHLARDLCFLVNTNEPWNNIITAVSQTPNVNRVSIFDLYQGDRLPENKKSISLRLHIKGDGTMTTEQINAIMNQAITNAEKAGGSLRA